MQIFANGKQCLYSIYILSFFVNTAAWLAQLGERRTAVREVEGSSPRLDQHSES